MQRFIVRVLGTPSSTLASTLNRRGLGHRITDIRQQGRSTGNGYERVRVAFDRSTRLGYIEVLN